MGKQNPCQAGPEILGLTGTHLPQAEDTGDTGQQSLSLLLSREDGVKLDLLSILESTLSLPCLPGHMVCREAASDWVFGRWRELC